MSRRELKMPFGPSASLHTRPACCPCERAPRLLRPDVSCSVQSSASSCGGSLGGDRAEQWKPNCIKAWDVLFSVTPTPPGSMVKWSFLQVYWFLQINTSSFAAYVCVVKSLLYLLVLVRPADGSSSSSYSSNLTSPVFDPSRLPLRVRPLHPCFLIITLK